MQGLADHSAQYQYTPVIRDYFGYYSITKDNLFALPSDLSLSLSHSLSLPHSHPLEASSKKGISDTKNFVTK